jgi:hypothetical protein
MMDNVQSENLSMVHLHKKHLEADVYEYFHLSQWLNLLVLTQKQ